jgi:hypothetical protein
VRQRYGKWLIRCKYLADSRVSGHLVTWSLDLISQP